LKQLLAILVPTHTATDLQTYLLGDTSLAEIDVLNQKVEVGVAITGQGAFNKHKLMDVKCKCWQCIGIEVRGKIVPEENPARLTYLRQTSADLYPEADFYLIVDHNLEFRKGSARRYLQAVDFLNKRPDVGAIFCGSHKEGFGERIVPYTDAHNSTSRGILVRNDQEGLLFPFGTLDLAGSADESVLAVWINLKGLWVYKQWNNPSIHYPIKGREFLEKGKTIKNNVHNWDVANENCFRWCREKLMLPEETDMYGRRFVNTILK
jgi:hypothetical protein